MELVATLLVLQELLTIVHQGRKVMRNPFHNHTHDYLLVDIHISIKMYQFQLRGTRREMMENTFREIKWRKQLELQMDFLKTLEKKTIPLTNPMLCEISTVLVAEVKSNTSSPTNVANLLKLHNLKWSTNTIYG